jgi:hypothetical protein
VIGGEPTWDEFITVNRWAILTTLRSSQQPVSSVVAYARRDDLVVVSTPGATFKRQSIARDGRVSLCIINNAEPFNFVSIEGRCAILSDNIEADTSRVFSNIEDVGYAMPEDLNGWLRAQQRVILEIHPERVYGVIR